MFDLVTWLAMAGSVVAHTLAAVCFKIAAQQNVRRRVIGYFVLGNAVGFFNPLCLTIAFKGNHPNLLLATMGGIGGAFFIIVLNRVFHEKLYRRQWLALGIIMIGTILLQITSTNESSDKKQPSPTSISDAIPGR